MTLVPLCQCSVQVGEISQTEGGVRRRHAQPHRHVSHSAACRPEQTPKPDGVVGARPDHQLQPGDQSEGSIHTFTLKLWFVLGQ